jgi:hypothetical protein
MLVRELAYLKWEQAGRPEGLSDYFWREAERDVRHRSVSEPAAAAVAIVPPRPRPRRPAFYLPLLRRLATAWVLGVTWLVGPSVHYSS